MPCANTVLMQPHTTSGQDLPWQLLVCQLEVQHTLGPAPPYATLSLFHSCGYTGTKQEAKGTKTGNTRTLVSAFIISAQGSSGEPWLLVRAQRH